MKDYLQLHLLTSYPPACLNRDDLNRPKTAVMGGVPRLRISSQSLKRAWRTSDVFLDALTGRTGVRSKELGRKIKAALLSGTSLQELLKPRATEVLSDGSITDDQATEWAWQISSVFVDKKAGGKSNVGKDSLKSEQIVFYGCSEIAAINNLIRDLRDKKAAPSTEQLNTVMLNSAINTADLALFGRMLASSPDCNIEAACQVAHAFTVHRIAVEDDFFTAVDDLNRREEDAGSAHMGEQGFAAGLFYLYACIDCGLLQENLNVGEDKSLVYKTIKALVETVATVAPTGKQNSFGSRAWASYILAEKGTRQPRSLSVAFLEPVKSDSMLQEAIERLEKTRENLDLVYFPLEANEVDGKAKKKVANSLPSYSVNCLKGEGDFPNLLKFVEL